MPTLELAIDARRAEQGAKQAETALRTVTQQATQTERAFTSVAAKIDASGSSLNAAFSATSGGLSVTRGIATAAQGMQQLNAATVGFAAATALLDASRLANDFRAVASTATRVSRDIYGIETVVKTSTTAWATFGAVLKAHPVLFIATAISAAAALMTAFSNNTKEAANSWQTFGTALSKSRIDEQAAKFLGISPQNAQQGQLDALLGLVGEQIANPRYRSLGDVASTLQVGQATTAAQIARFTRQNGSVNQYARDYVRNGAFFGLFQDGRTSSSNAGDIGLSPEDIQYLLRERYREITSARSQSGIPQIDLAGGGVPDYLRAPGGGPVVTGSSVSPYGTGTVLIGESQRSQVELERQTQAADAADARMEELIEKGREFGATIGDAFFNVASGAQTARQAIAGLVADLARAASRQAFSNLFGAVVGATATQSRADGGGPGSNIVLPD